MCEADKPKKGNVAAVQTTLHFVFIILSLCQVLASDKLIRNSPIGNEIVIKEGEMLSIRYNGFAPLQFIYPNTIGESINTSNSRIYYERINYFYIYNFTRPNTVFGDTGWYACTNHNFDYSINFDDTEMNWLYVYVRSNTNLFVEAHTNVHLSAVAGGSIVIPCRTTWPDLKPSLINGNKDELTDVSFDSKIGFTIKNLSLEDSNRYKCTIEKDGKVHTVSYILSVLKQVLSEPKIQVNDLFVTRGQDLKINCTIEMNLSMEYKFDWNMPQQNNSRRSIQQFIKYLNGNTTVRVTSQLTIFNVTDEDEGNYECIVRSIYDIKKIKKNIRIYDPQIKRIEFLPEYDNLYFQKEAGSHFNLIVYVSAFLDTHIEWLYSNGMTVQMQPVDTIMSIKEFYDSNGLNSSYIKMFSNFSILSLQSKHSANYTIQAKNGYMIKKMNFTLDVKGKPNKIEISISSQNRDSYFLRNESAKLDCSVISNPPPNITWSFLKCPNYPSLKNSTTIDLTNVQNLIYYDDDKYESIVIIPIEISGKITCKACNNFGCDSITEKIIVSDLVPPFFIKTNMNETKTRIIDVAVEDNTVKLQCFAKGIPTPIVTWYKDNILLEKTNQYDFNKKHQELHINYLNLKDSGNYSCQANNSIGTNETYQQIIVKNTKWNTFDIALVTSIPILGFILITLAISFTIKIYREKKMRRDLMEVGLMHFEKGTLECLNPNLTVDDQAELLPYDKKWEFPRDRIILKEQLGCGHFGMVMKAEAIGIHKNESISTVAVKMVRRTTNPVFIRALASELKIMVHLGKHLNVVNLLGAYTKNISKCNYITIGELLVIVEYCRFGNMNNYLLRHRNDFINQINPKTGKYDFTIGMDVLTRTVNIRNDNSYNSDIDMITYYNLETNLDFPKTNPLPNCVLSGSSSQSERGPNYYINNENHNPKPICTKDLLSWAFQVARGMEYLSQRKILHGDLAARNILLAEDNVVKICDFGLAKIMYKDGNYKKKSNDPVPIKWMAIESIRDQIFSTQSDVWSFGIMLWEFFTLAKTPYPCMEVKEQYRKLIEGYRLERPDYAIDEIYDIMLQCWIAKPTLRPSFTDLAENIGNLLEESVRMHYITLNNSYMDINAMNLKNGKKDYLMMMSAPDHAILSLPTNKCVNPLFLNENSDSSDLHISSGCPTDESKIFISHSADSNIEAPSPTSDFEDAIDLSSMLKREEDPYLKPINVHKRRAEFVRQGEVIKNKMADKLIDENSVYYNVLRKSLHRSERHEQE